MNSSSAESLNETGPESTGVSCASRGASMTDRYDLLLASIAASNKFMVQMFIFALLAVIAYPVLNWTPVWMRRPAKYIYLALMLAAFILTTVLSGHM
jgi:hypothetical protein